MNILDVLDQKRAVRIRKKALQRLFSGAQRGSLVPAKTSLSAEAEADAKLALILVNALNPREHMTKGELALLTGVNVKTLAVKEAQEKSSVAFPPAFRRR